MLFGPSRFVGYRNNTRSAHEMNDRKDGKETNPTISRALRRQLVEDDDLEQEYRRFCERIGVSVLDKIRRKYWPAHR